MMRLIHGRTGLEVKPGNVIEDFRGEQWKLLSVLSNRKVYVESLDPKCRVPQREFFAHVFNCEVVES